MNKGKKNEEEIDLLKEINKSLKFQELFFNDIGKVNGLMKYEGNVLLHLYFKEGMLMFLHTTDKKFTYFPDIVLIPIHNIKEAIEKIQSIVQKIKLKNIFNGDNEEIEDLVLLERSSAGRSVNYLIGDIWDRINIKNSPLIEYENYENRVEIIKRKILSDTNKSIKDLIVLLYGYEFINFYKMDGKIIE